jgi:uncharacterized membrane protein YphA (DoxX/SURF4 family)
MPVNAAAVGLSVVFLTAGYSKLRDSKATTDSAIAFGLPTWLARGAGRLLPGAEIGLSVCLALPATAELASAVSAGLMALYVFLVARVLFLGKPTSCSCFGSGARFVSSQSLFRNVALLAASLIAAAGRGPSLNARLHPLLGSVLLIILWSVAISIYAILDKSGTNNSVEQANEPREVEVPLIRKRERLPGGEGGPTTVVFIRSNCHACEGLVRDLGPDAATSREPQHHRLIVLISGQSDFAKSLRSMIIHWVDIGVIDKDYLEALGVDAFPAFIRFLPDGRESHRGRGYAAVRQEMADIGGCSARELAP